MRYRLLASLVPILVLVMLVAPAGASSVAYLNYTEDFVDATSNLHLATPDIGTHSSFAEMQDKDGTFDTLTEADVGGGGVDEDLHVNAFDSTASWTTMGSGYTALNSVDGDYIETKLDTTIVQWFDFPSTTATGDANVEFFFWGWNQDGAGNDYCNIIIDWTGTGAGTEETVTWGAHTAPATEESFDAGSHTVAEINACRVGLIMHKVTAADEVACDMLYMNVVQAGGSVYDLDLEVGWTTADYDESVEFLCIFGGTQGSEDLRVDIWSGSWVNLWTDIQTGWNNISIASYLTDATVEIRFTDTSGDSDTADTWQIEGVLLRTHSYAYTETFNEEIPLADSSSVSMGASNTINEVIPISDSSSNSAGFGVVVTEIIGLYDSVVVAMDAVLVIMEQIGFSEGVAVGVNFALNILEVIGLSASVVATKGVGGNEYVVNIFEVIGASDTVNTALSASVTVFDGIGINESIETALAASVSIFEIIEITDIAAAYRGQYLTVFETILLSDSTTATQLIHYYVNEVIGLTPSTGLTGGVAATPDIESLFYQLFISLNMWGYLGPIALVIGGYFATRKASVLGIIWFIVECLVVGFYLNLVDATPDYWWHIFIVLLGGLFTIVYPLWERR